MMSRTARAVMVLALALPGVVAAQVRASERATVSQMIDGTRITLDYARPKVRGRAIFGKRVHWGEVWTPGANWATTVDVTRDVTIDSIAVPKGKYSVWFTVGPDRWTVLLDPRPVRYHTEIPDTAAGQIRWSIIPEATTGSVEMLTWAFPEVRPDGGVLEFRWADRRVAFDIGVHPSHPLPIALSEATPYVGTYEWRWGDSTSTESLTRIELYHDGTMLRQRYTPKPDWYPQLQDQPMVRINDGWFVPTIIRDGKVFEMTADMIFEFTVVNGKAVSFEMRGDNDELLGLGRRVPM